MHLSLPWKLVSIHSTLILLFMFTLWRRWFLLDIPFDDFYAPFFFTSGPIVYFMLGGCSTGRSPFSRPEHPSMVSWDLDSRMRVSAAWRSSVVLDRSVVDVVPAISCCWTCDIVGLTCRELSLSR